MCVCFLSCFTLRIWSPSGLSRGNTEPHVDRSSHAIYAGALHPFFGRLGQDPGPSNAQGAISRWNRHLAVQRDGRGLPSLPHKCPGKDPNPGTAEVFRNAASSEILRDTMRKIRKFISLNIRTPELSLKGCTLISLWNAMYVVSFKGDLVEPAGHLRHWCSPNAEWIWGTSRRKISL